MELQEITGMKLSTNITIWPKHCSSAYRLLVRQVTYTGDNLANTLVMKKRGERRGGVFGALIVRTPTLPKKYPTPMSPQIPPPLHFTNLKANFCQIPNAPLHQK